MQRYPAHFVNQARRLASDGFTYKKISQKLNVSPSQISVWCNVLSEGSHLSTIRTHQTRRKLLLDSGEEVLRDITLDKNHARIYCGILYGCEGSKYPASNGVALTNADPELILCFLTLLRKAFNINEEKLRVHLQIHNNQNYQELIAYWERLLNISKTQFYKPTITKPNGRKHRSKYLGTTKFSFNLLVFLKLL